jgi:hypothetical protein
VVVDVVVVVDLDGDGDVDDDVTITSTSTSATSAAEESAVQRSFPGVAAVACLLALACGPPDNQVNGGVVSTNPAYPDAVISKVRSAIHGVGTVTNQRDGATTQRSVVVLSSVDNLCRSLEQFPSYFKDGGAPETHAALVMMAAPGILGDFLLAGTNAQADVSYLAAFKGGPVTVLPGVAGDLNLVDFDPGGNARGTFNVIVSYGTNGQAFVEGRFKTDFCGAIGPTTYLPRYR